MCGELNPATCATMGGASGTARLIGSGAGNFRRNAVWAASCRSNSSTLWNSKALELAAAVCSPAACS